MATDPYCLLCSPVTEKNPSYTQAGNKPLSLVPAFPYLKGSRLSFGEFHQMLIKILICNARDLKKERNSITILV